MSAMTNWISAGHSAPILYLPMKDAATAHINEGTGGNMVQNGTLDTAGRGANQDNCVASYFDGAADYLSRTSLTGIADGKQFTFSCNALFKAGLPYVRGLFTISVFGITDERCEVALASDFIFVELKDVSGASIAYARTANNSIPLFSTINIAISIDTSTSSIMIYINGVNKTSEQSITANAICDFTTSYYYVGYTRGYYTNGNIGELYFDTKYIDLAANNPFWDSVANKPKPVRQVIRETGVTPIIASPLDASNPTPNYGTGGAWTANSAPYVGARGASEYWQRTTKYDGSTSYFSRAGLLSITDANKLTFVANVYKSASVLYHLVGTTNSSVSISINASNQLVITAKNAAGTTILSATVTTTIANTTWTKILVSIDLSNTANRSVYLNGVAASVTWTTYTNDTIDFTVASIIVGADIALANKFNGSMSLWLDNTYTDFTSEVNRNKYIDQLGYPKDLNSQVTDAIIAKPALFLNSDNTSALGTNSGYGGDMTANGTIVAGADVFG